MSTKEARSKSQSSRRRPNGRPATLVFFEDDEDEEPGPTGGGGAGDSLWVERLQDELASKVARYERKRQRQGRGPGRGLQEEEPAAVRLLAVDPRKAARIRERKAGGISRPS